MADSGPISLAFSQLPFHDDDHPSVQTTSSPASSSVSSSSSAKTDMATDRKPRGACWQLVKRMTRKKLIDMSDTQTSLHRCLTAKRLTFVGIGSMVGAGIYVLVGIADKNLAGPSVIISFLLAALCICMTSFCFAEFASRNPKSGNPYLYIYVAYGEFMAFIVSWGFILSYIASGSLCARAWSGYVDSLVNNSIKNYTMKHIGNWTVGEPISQFPDFLGFGIQFFITFIAATGAHCSTTVNSVLTGLNVAVLSLVMVMGAVYGNLDNWHNVEHGGFFPFGFEGVMQGTSACFYAFFGFETVCIAAEEAKDPSKSVPRGIIASIAITTLLYVGTATAFTLLVPFWLVNERAPLTTAFDYAGPSWMKYVVSIGPLCGFSNILLLNTYGFSRLCYSLSEEGLLWKSCSRVNRRTKVPMIPLFVGGLAMALGGLCLELENLFRFSVIVTILPYALVSFGVIILRYDSRYNKLKLQSTGDCKFLQPEKEAEGGRLGGANLLGFCPDFLKKELWILISCFGIRIYILIIFLATALLSAMVLFDWNGVKQMTASSVLTFCILVAIILGSIIAITSHERPEPLSLFKVPLVPFFPIVSGMLNVFFLVAAIDKGSAIGYVVIVVIGISIYLGICVWDLLQSGSTGHSAAQTEMEMENLLTDSEDHTFTQASSS